MACAVVRGRWLCGAVCGCAGLAAGEEGGALIPTVHDNGGFASHLG